MRLPAVRNFGLLIIAVPGLVAALPAQTRSPTSLSTTAIPGALTLEDGTFTLEDSAVIVGGNNGGNNASGTVTYSFYTNGTGSGSPLFRDQVSVV